MRECIKKLEMRMNQSFKSSPAGKFKITHRHFLDLDLAFEGK